MTFPYGTKEYNCGRRGRPIYAAHGSGAPLQPVRLRHAAPDGGNANLHVADDHVTSNPRPAHATGPETRTRRASLTDSETADGLCTPAITNGARQAPERALRRMLVSSSGSPPQSRGGDSREGRESKNGQTREGPDRLSGEVFLRAAPDWDLQTAVRLEIRNQADLALPLRLRRGVCQYDAGADLSKRHPELRLHAPP